MTEGEINPISKEKILVITGDGAFGEKIADILKRDGYNVSLVKNGVEGMKKIYDILPHLILLDVVIIGGDSYAILAEKQAEPMLAKIPVFLLSTQGIPINMTRVPEGSVEEFVMALHSDPESILRRVNRHFGHSKEPVEVSGPTIAPEDQKTIVWVEDDKLIGSILEKKFVSSGFKLIHTVNGEETLKELAQVVPDAIVLDLILPGMSGFEILEQIKKDDRLKKVPIMILSNLSKPSDMEKARILGAQKFLVKASASLEQVVKEVRALCN